MFLVSVLLCADSFTCGKIVDEEVLTKVVPLAAESSRLKETVLRLVEALDKG
jgi:hypothetical protein